MPFRSNSTPTRVSEHQTDSTNHAEWYGASGVRAISTQVGADTVHPAALMTRPRAMARGNNLLVRANPGNQHEQAHLHMTGPISPPHQTFQGSTGDGRQLSLHRQLSQATLDILGN